ncbi:MAG: diaminopimelate epimerase [Halothiobacillus sp. 24-54-40]|jgi:diaminopimelate epimerase|nr:diaminopimelate epimerase [Halothiobacillaceae bacterium]OYV46523.1 MAG: diaminopimelate epimerase [Halothiobacillus sp. 20-53-49]OYY42956.1 MAG: diaminopimelate epimerase [Halothiobacillus sp. 35-54-62]OYZ88038.1 MAG: diaminopimelate epimerase [Halothiobacillus sp. 24-54-40]OZA81575.1 MAG: diaminopimelate epimerase [Halothiobacillus sp. 39-53-45]
MPIQFTKMHGLGNDFMVIDAINQPLALNPATIKLWADRHFGIGFDQLLVVEPPKTADTLFTYRIFNADGSEVEQCGNGARCFARFVFDKGLTAERIIPVGTASGRIVLSLTEDGGVTVNMGAPIFDPALIPFTAEAASSAYELALPQNPTGLSSLTIDAVSMGNPHAVIDVKDINTAPVRELGAIIEQHPRFPNRTNVGFMQRLDSHTINLRVFERGAGETLACGTGACAAAVSGIRRGVLLSPVTINVRGGQLHIEWRGEPSEPVMMTGPATHVFDGVI